MAFRNLDRSWSFGENATYGSTFILWENQDVPSLGLLTGDYSCGGDDHLEGTSSIFNSGNFSHGHDYMDNRAVSSPEQQQSFSLGCGALFESTGPICEQEKHNLTFNETLLTTMGQLLQLFEKFQTRNDEILGEHLERLQVLEQPKSSNEETISAQEKRIETLESTVENL